MSTLQEHEERIFSLERKFDNLLTELQQTNAALGEMPEDVHQLMQDVGELRQQTELNGKNLLALAQNTTEILELLRRHLEEHHGMQMQVQPV